jgi:type II secretory pathway component GspD/PulD (secretin)
LIITTSDKARANFKQVVYPVTDLIIPVEDHPIPDVYNPQAVLERCMANQSTLQNYMGASPVNTNTMQMPPGPPVSSYGSGLANAFGSMSQGHTQTMTSPSTAMQRRSPRQTMEDLLMDLIKGTIHPHTWKDMGGPGTIQYYPLGMALVINQTQEVQGEIEDLLRALRRLLDLEISIEMRLVSVSESFYERIGMDFNVNLETNVTPGVQNQLLNSSFTPFGTINKNLNFRNVLTGLTPAGTLTPDLGIPLQNSSFNFSVPPFGGYTAPGVDGGLSLGLAFLSDIQVFMVLEAAQGDSRTNIMQAPKITVFNGQTATISVSVTQFLNLGITFVPVNGQIIAVPNNVGFPVRVTALVVTPVVSADRRFVRLNLTPNLTNLIGNDIPVFPVQIPLPNVVEGPLGQGVQVGQPVINTTFLIQQPAISTITLSTTVNVPDGGTVLLGGLKTMSEGRNEAGPPILDKIPYLDRLFRNVGWGREGQSLMIMVTPRIIINEEEERIFLGQEAPIPRP